MTTISFRIAANTGARFAPNAFGSQIGKNIPLYIRPDRIEAKVVDGEVSGDGSSVLVTLEVAEGQDIQLKEIINGDTPATFAGYSISAL